MGQLLFSLQACLEDLKSKSISRRTRGQPLYVLPDPCPLPLTSNVNSRPVLPLQESQLRKGHGVKFEHTFGDLTRVLKALTLSRIKVKCVGEQGMV